MAGGIYNSIYKGSEWDATLKKVIDSGVTTVELTVLHGAVLGTAIASKALVLNATKDIIGINELGVVTLTGRVLKLQDDGTDVIGNPITGYAYLYLKSSNAYIKTALGVITKIGVVEPITFEFVNVSSIVCEHNLGTKYPTVMIVGTDDQLLGGQVYYQNDTTLIVSFNSEESGRVICKY